MADQNHCLLQKWTHKVSNISRYVLLTSQSYRFPRHHCLASDINLCCRVWLCIRSSISWCCGGGQTDQALTNSLHIALRRTDCIASCILLHFVDQIILQEERITLWVALHWIVTIHPRWQIRSVQMTAWQESSICSNHHFALNHQIGTQLSDRHPNYQRYYHTNRWATNYTIDFTIQLQIMSHLPREAFYQMPNAKCHRLNPRPKCPFYQIISGRLQAIWQHGARLPKSELLLRLSLSQTQPG